MATGSTSTEIGKSSLRQPSRRVAEAAARALVAAHRKMGTETDPRVLDLANLPQAG